MRTRTPIIHPKGYNVKGQYCRSDRFISRPRPPGGAMATKPARCVLCSPRMPAARGGETPARAARLTALLRTRSIARPRQTSTKGRKASTTNSGGWMCAGWLMAVASQEIRPVDAPAVPTRPGKTKRLAPSAPAVQERAKKRAGLKERRLRQHRRRRRPEPPHRRRRRLHRRPGQAGRGNPAATRPGGQQRPRAKRQQADAAPGSQRRR